MDRALEAEAKYAEYKKEERDSNGMVATEISIVILG